MKYICSNCKKKAKLKKCKFNGQKYFYIKCKKCKLTTPGFPTIEEAEEHWKYYRSCNESE